MLLKCKKLKNWLLGEDDDVTTRVKGFIDAGGFKNIKNEWKIVYWHVNTSL